MTAILQAERLGRRYRNRRALSNCTLQWAETGLYLLGSILLAGFCFWWTRTRLA